MVGNEKRLQVVEQEVNVVSLSEGKESEWLMVTEGCPRCSCVAVTKLLVLLALGGLGRGYACARVYQYSTSDLHKG